MSFYDVLEHYRDLSSEAFDRIPPHDVERVLALERLGAEDLFVLLSSAAADFLEPMARKAHEITLRYFGRTIQLYTPIYVSNYCENNCVYCGFNVHNRIERRRLSLEEVAQEAAAIASTGLRHILLLTGESRVKSSVLYIRDCVTVLKQHFASVAIEVYPLSVADYALLIEAGVDGLTIYQETYDEERYAALHLAGPKRDFRFRLDAPERGACAGMRQVSIGALLGLGEWRREVLLTALHARYLQERCPDVEIGISLPRMRPHAGQFASDYFVTDRQIVQIMTALRLVMPRLGMAISTREAGRFRENILPLGVTRMSAGSTTRVGGHTLSGVRSDGAYADEADGAPQFEIADDRSVAEMAAMIRRQGYDPVFKDWMLL